MNSDAKKYTVAVDFALAARLALAALPDAEPAPVLASPAQPAGYGDWLSTLDPHEPPSPAAVWAAALAWAAGRVEAAGPAIMRPIKEALAGDWRDPQGYVRWGAVEAEALNIASALAAAIRAGRP